MHFLRPRVWSDCMHDASFHSFDCWSFMDKLSVPLKKWEWNLTINFYYLSHRILKQTKHLYPKKEAKLSIFYKPANTMQGKVSRKIYTKTTFHQIKLQYSEDLDVNCKFHKKTLLKKIWWQAWFHNHIKWCGFDVC